MINKYQLLISLAREVMIMRVHKEQKQKNDQNKILVEQPFYKHV